jgi:hypothetical protein
MYQNSSTIANSFGPFGGLYGGVDSAMRLWYNTNVVDLIGLSLRIANAD